MLTFPVGLGYSGHLPTSPGVYPSDPESINVRMMKPENRIDWRRHSCHYVPNNIVKLVVWCTLKARLVCVARSGLEIDEIGAERRER
jgi:hypothetical protein